MSRFAFCAALLPLMLFATPSQEDESCPDGKRPCRAAVRHIESGGIGYEEGYTTFETFFAPDPSRWKVTPFLDARGHVFDNGKWAANVGMGLRALWKKRVYGINTYYDYRNAGPLQSNQIGVGAETLGKVLDFRINGYLPVGAKLSAPYNIAFNRFSGHHMLVSQTYQSAMKGLDAEIGLHFAESSPFHCYAAAGPYYFTGKLDPNTWGGKARIGITFKDIITLEISDSYDNTFHNKFQGQISVGFSFGPKSKVKKQPLSCPLAGLLNRRMLQPVARQEIVVINQPEISPIATDPVTGKPYIFVFVNNTSSSSGTYESPFHSFTQVEQNSSPNDIIYVFPGDGSTLGMNKGIALQNHQKLWGSGYAHTLPLSTGPITIPAQSHSSPTITNSDIDTDGNAITLSTSNAISGINIHLSLNDGIYGTNLQNLEISYCTIENVSTYALEASFAGTASLTLSHNQFLNNTNGIAATFNGTSNFTCTYNTFKNQTSVSSIPVNVISNNNTLYSYINNNTFNQNATGGIRFNLNNIISNDISILNNTLTNNGSGSQSTLGSAFVIIPDGLCGRCALILDGNTFSDNAAYAIYTHTSGHIAQLQTTITSNTISYHGGHALAISSPTDDLTVIANNNQLAYNEGSIVIATSNTPSTGTITINNNTISNVSGYANGIALNQDCSSLNLTALNNTISDCEGTGIISYSPTGIDDFTINIANNRISGCENLPFNAASGIDIEQYIYLTGTIENNVLSGNTGLGVIIGSTLTSPYTCINLRNNTSSTDYLVSNPIDGTFYLSPCNANTVNIGVINRTGVITPVKSCPNIELCSP